MEYNEFVEQAALRLKELLPEHLAGAEVCARQVNKIQGGSYYGISLVPEGSSTGITYGLGKEYQQFCEGADFDEILQTLPEALERQLREAPLQDKAVLNSYDTAKKTLAMQTIPIAGNEAMLDTLPHLKKEDFALIYRFVLREDERGTVSTIVTNHALEIYRITPEQLHRDALEYAPRNHPMRIRSMKEILEEFLEVPVPMNEGDMLVATLEGGQNGAGCLFYPDFGEQAAARIGGDYFVLPSSIHEVILLPDTGDITAREMEDIVRTINIAEVAPEERLTDTVYHYDAKEKLFESARAFERRREAVREAAPVPHRKPPRSWDMER